MRSRRAVHLLFVPLLAALGCSNTSVRSLPDVATAKARWMAAGVRSYTYVSSHACFCPLEYTRALRTSVRAGQVTSVVDEETGAAQPLESRRSIDGLFTLLDQELQARPANLEATFDPSSGYPLRIKYGTPENDGGGTIVVTSFTPVTP